MLYELGYLICDLMRPLIEDKEVGTLAWAVYEASRNTLRSGQTLREFLPALVYWLDKAKEIEQ